MDEFGGRPTVVFDVMGTLVDEHATLRDEAIAALSPEAGPGLVEVWESRFADVVAEVVAGRAPWSDYEKLRARVLQDVLTEQGLPADGTAFARLATVGERLRPFPGVPEQLARLTEVARVAALTNTTIAAASRFSAAGGLRWHALLSAGWARTFKPRPEAYQVAVDLLGLAPSEGIFVAAHPWDLRAAAEHGFRTAYLPRPDGGRPDAGDRFDYVLESLDDLTEALR